MEFVNTVDFSLFKWFSFDDHHLIRACGVPNPGDVKDKEEVLKQVEETVAPLFG